MPRATCRSTSSSGHGRGPTRLMSPRRMLTSCGSSSRYIGFSTRRPAHVRFATSASYGRTCPAATARTSRRSVRNFRSPNVRPADTRGSRYKSGPRSRGQRSMSSPTAPTTAAHTGASSTSSEPETATSSVRFARSVVMPSDPLEVPLPFPVRDEAVEEPLLGSRVVEVVVDDLVAERGARHGPRLERGDRVAQGRGEPLRVGLVCVALERRRRLELLLEPVEARRDQRREREVRVDVAARNPCLDPASLAVPDNAEAARAVVVPPGERRRRPAPGRVALVRVNGRREEHGKLLRARDLSREPPAEQRVVARERRLVAAEERRVDMARVADPVLERLRHERDRAPVEERDLLGAVLVDGVVVGHRQRVGEAEVELLLTRPRLALRRLDAHPGGLHPVAER